MSVELPFVLAGPVLKRCSATEIFVWVALSKKIDEVDANQFLELEVYNTDKLPTSTQMLEGRRFRHTIAASYEASELESLAVPKGVKDGTAVTHIPVAQNLHIYFLRATAFKKSLPLEIPLAYEIYLVKVIQPIAPKTEPEMQRYGLCEHLQGERRKVGDEPVYTRGYKNDLKNKEFFAFSSDLRTKPLIYDDKKPLYVLPTFILQGKDSDLRVWAGSCLKLHGDGICATKSMYNSKSKRLTDAGALPKSMKANSVDKSDVKRPHALFLMGDQIYADDVSFILFEGVRELGKLLIGNAEEFLPEPDKQSVWQLTAQLRHDLVGEQNKKTPFALEDSVQNQLMSLGEFCAYYLMHFNAALWPDLQQAKDRAITSTGYWSRDKKDKILKIELERLIQSQQAIYDYAAVQANVPVYAMFDDHEVTDDWFFDKEWIDPIKTKKKAKQQSNLLENSPIGKYIIANALYAYAAFQGIGNDPEKFVKRILALNGAPNNKNYEAVLESLIDNDWSFFTPTLPTACFLDTRTQRSGDGKSSFLGLAANILDYQHLSAAEAGMVLPKNRNLPQMLMSSTSAASNIIGKALSSEGADQNNIFLVTPSPLLSSDKVESAKITIRNGRPQWLRNDAELWRSNYSNYFMLVELLSLIGVTNCLNVAGDLHYGYHRVATISRENSNKNLLVINQIVSSPLLNQFELRFGERGLDDFVIGKVQNSALENDYDYPLRLSRSLGNINSENNAWIVQRKDQKTTGIAQPSYLETLTAGVCFDSNKSKIEAPIKNNHFVELCIKSNCEISTKPIFHFVKT